MDPRLCAEASAQPKLEGSVVAPVNDAERVATAAFLGSVQALIDWGRQGWARSALALPLCPR